MPNRRARYRFVIDEAFTPESLPMARLAEYMAHLATLIGEKAHVHFVAVEEGSTVLVQDVDWEARPKVQIRLRALRHREGPAEAIRAYDLLNDRLAEDNATGRLIEDLSPEEPEPRPPVRVLEFPGRRESTQPEYGPFSQSDELIGVVIVVGGETDPVPVHLQDPNVIHICRARRPLARQLAVHLFTTPLRVNGIGRWYRNAAGHWFMKHFVINDFVPLREQSLSEAVEELRNVPARWKTISDPLGELKRIRNGDE